MQRFELVAGASAKFWEIGRDDVTVTVRFGRLGATGQTQTKTFGSVAEAEAHRAKLVAEKVEEGLQAARVGAAGAGGAGRRAGGGGAGVDGDRR